MRKVIHYIFFNFLLTFCSHKKEVQIEAFIRVADSYEIDLSTNTYKVYYLTKEAKEIKFHFTRQDSLIIREEFNNLLLTTSYDNKIIEDSCFVSPKLYTNFLFKGKDKKNNSIKISLGCDKYSKEDIDLAKKLKKFISLVKEIVFSKNEIKQIPESDVFYY